MFDSHAHLDDERFDGDRDACVERAVAAGVRAMVIPAISPDRWARTLACAQRGPVYAALGVHPQALPTVDDRAVREGLDRVASLVRANPGRVVAIGEVGFDHTIDLQRASRERQAQVFAWHAEVAVALDLPLIVHVLRAHDAALEALARVKLPSRAGVIHSYSGSAELVAQYEKRGFYLSFAGAITRPTAKKPVLAARAVSADRLLIETDAPDQCPTGAMDPSEPCRCEPAMLALTARAVARARAEDEAAVRAQCERNARTLFAL